MGQGKTANFNKIFEKCQICTLLNVTEPFEITSQAALKVHLASVHGFNGQNGQNGKISDQENKSQNFSNPEVEKETESEPDSQMDTESFNENYYEEDNQKIEIQDVHNKELESDHEQKLMKKSKKVYFSESDLESDTNRESSNESSSTDNSEFENISLKQAHGKNDIIQNISIHEVILGPTHHARGQKNIFILHFYIKNILFFVLFFRMWIKM